jgi:hypothetical protein
MSIPAFFLAIFLSFNSPIQHTSVIPIQDPLGVSFCTAFSVNQKQRLYLTAAHCVDSKSVDLPVPTMFSQRIQVLKQDKFIDLALIQAALGVKAFEIAEQPPGLGGKVIAAGYAGDQELLSVYVGTFHGNAIGVDQKKNVHVISMFDVRAEHGMSGGPILNEEGQFQGAIVAHEQWDAELVLEPPDQVADRGLGDIQLLRRTGEAEMPRRRLEGAQPVERGEDRHGTKCIMTLAHVWTDKVSFVGHRATAHLTLSSPIKERRPWPRLSTLPDKFSATRRSAVVRRAQGAAGAVRGDAAALAPAGP